MSLSPLSGNYLLHLILTSKASSFDLKVRCVFNCFKNDFKILDEVDFDLELETPCDEEDIEKRFYEVTECDLDENCAGMSDSGLFGTNKSKAAKQLQSVAKQFGSIGKRCLLLYLVEILPRYQF